MFYYLGTYLHRFPGMGLFNYISFRTAMAFLASLVVALIFGRRIIDVLQKKQVGEVIRNLGLAGQIEKQGTPTMGGLIILAAVLVPTLLFANLSNVYVILLIVSTLWLGTIGFLDDYIKVFKKDKKGLAGKFKMMGQIGLGLIVGTTLYFNNNVVIRQNIPKAELKEYKIEHPDETVSIFLNDKTKYYMAEHRSMETTIPFVKSHSFDYAEILSFLGDGYRKWSFLIYIPIVIFIITAVSNGANLTDGLDGLATGVSAIILFTLAVFAWLSGNIIFSNYLNIMYIPNLSEVVIFTGALMGACVGFLWFNAYPAQVFMGDTGSLTLGGLIAVLAIIVRKELLIPVLCGVFLVENLSVIIQVSYFKYTKKKYGEGRRVFKMSPLHHHYQKMQYHESKIVARFWIVTVFLAMLTIITLKIR